MTDSKLLDIVEDIKNLSTSGNVIKVEEYKKGKKIKRQQRQQVLQDTLGTEQQKQLGRAGRAKKKKLPIYVITHGNQIILEPFPKNLKKNKNYSNQ